MRTTVLLPVSCSIPTAPLPCRQTLGGLPDPPDADILEADPLLVMLLVMDAGKPTTHPHPRGQTNTCENITLPQTSFAGGNKDF